MATEIPLDELSALFARIRGLLLSQETVDHAVELLAQAAKETIIGSIGAGVTLIDPAGRKTSTGSTDTVVKQADDLQYDAGQGPCLSAWASTKTVRVDELATDPRWPVWAAAVSALPIQSTLSTPLLHRGHAIGALKVYSPTPYAFTVADGRLLEKFAVPAAALLAHVQTTDAPRRLSETLTAALDNRDVINIGRGILMEREQLDEAAATAALLRTSREKRIPLREVAEQIVASIGQDG